MYYRELSKQDMIPYRVFERSVVRRLRFKKFWDPIESDENRFFDQVWTYFQGCFSDDGIMIGAAGLFMNPADVAEHAIAVGLEPEPTAEISRCMVMQPFRGRGICHKMVDALALRAQVQGKTDLIMAVHPDDNGMRRIAARMEMKADYRQVDTESPKVIFRLKLV